MIKQYNLLLYIQITYNIFLNYKKKLFKLFSINVTPAIDEQNLSLNSVLFLGGMTEDPLYQDDPSFVNKSHPF